MSLSERLRGGSECAPWVVEEVEDLEAKASTAKLTLGVVIKQAAAFSEQMNAMLAAIQAECRDLADDIDTCTQHNVELQLENRKLREALATLIPHVVMHGGFGRTRDEWDALVGDSNELRNS